MTSVVEQTLLDVAKEVDKKETQHPFEEGEELTGAEILPRALLAEGVDTVFGYPGGVVLSIYDSLFKTGIR